MASATGRKNGEPSGAKPEKGNSSASCQKELAVAEMREATPFDQQRVELTLLVLASGIWTPPDGLPHGRSTSLILPLVKKKKEPWEERTAVSRNENTEG